jgi:hypothetical protein
MALDPSIALGIRPLEVPNQLAQYAQMAQVENAQQQNALAQFQLGAARRAEQGQNALGQAYGAYYGGGGNMGGGAAASPAGETLAGMGVARGGINYDNMRQAIVDKLRTTAPNLIPAELARINEMEQKGLLARKTQTDIDTAGLTQQKSRQELATTRTAQFRDQLNKVNSPEAAVQWTIAMYNDPQLKDTISSVPLEAALAEIPKTPEAFNVWKNQNALGMTEFIKQNKPSVTAQATGGATRLLQTPGLGGPATVVPGSAAPITMSEYQIAANKIAQQQADISAGQLTLAQANAVKPVFNAEAGGFVSPPTKANPQGTFTPLGSIQENRDQQAAVKALKSAGYDVATGEDNISKLIEKSTSGGLQAISAATLAFVFGTSTKGREAISALEGTANQIATDLAGGKLGAGISNTDRDFIVGALGDVANSMKPVEERLAGWSAAKERMMRVGLIPPPKGMDQGNAAKGAPTPPPPKGIDQTLWNVMTPQERALWKK